MRKLLLSLLALAVSWTLFAADSWPDGTPMDKWFSTPVKALRGREARRFVITDYGATVDTATLQTAAIQRTIDAAARRGGTVVIPAGVWRSGALFFKPRTHLLLEEGAVLKGSTDTWDFPDVPVHIEGVLQPYAAALVNAEGCDGFSIRGSGTLDGSGLPYWTAFWARRKENPACTNLEVRRPRLVSVSRSKDVLLEGVCLRNSAFWNVHLYKCSRVRVKGVSILAPVKPVKAPSSDGIDLDACEDVHILDCEMATGDDLVAVKGGKGPWADQNPDNGGNAHILVEDCRFGHGPGVLVFGSECIRADNVVLRRCKVDGTDRLLWLKMRPDTPQHYAHIRIEDVKGKVRSVLYAKPWTQFFDLKGRTDIPKSCASDVLVQRCTLSCRRFRNIVDAPEQYAIDRLVFKDNKWKYIYNKDEAKVKPCSLEDPLVFADGTPVASPADWPRRRKEILELFQREMYGRLPAPMPIYLQTQEEGLALDGKALRRQIRMTFRPDGSGPHIDWLLLIPVGLADPAPAVLMLNYYGNHTVMDDEKVFVPDCWLDDSEMNGVVHNQATTLSRGMFTPERSRTTVFPLREMISRGYVFMTACYGDVSPDPGDPAIQARIARTGVFSLWKEDPSRDDNTGTLMAWAWALSRGLDLLEKEPSVDASRVLVTGSSRLGKAALLAGAFDERFAIVAPNQTGGGGVPLSKRNFGEYVASETEHFTHWWYPAFSKYAEAEDKLPFDQHLLLACVAPRPLLVEGFNNPWFDTRGEFLALQAASPVWTLLGAEGLPDVPWPADEDTSAIGRTLGYVRRSGAHGLFAADWPWILDFADKNFSAD